MRICSMTCWFITPRDRDIRSSRCIASMTSIWRDQSREMWTILPTLVRVAMSFFSNLTASFRALAGET